MNLSEEHKEYMKAIGDLNKKGKSIRDSVKEYESKMWKDYLEEIRTDQQMSEDSSKGPKVGSSIDEVVTALGMDDFECIQDYFVWLNRKEDKKYIEIGSIDLIEITEDSVNSPPHYNQGGVECIDALAASLGVDGFKAYCRGNVIKYLWRLEHKGKSLEDAKKARWYLNKLIERMEENG